ncbi:MAG: nucleotide pyrophosphohydrolase [Ruminococcaceae bacterium]|nr:nucleotide pyrophosphohydrolase [Oscillospiraceae bacterium]
MKVRIDILEDYLNERYSGRVNEQSLFMKLVEEMGEAAEVLNMRAGRKDAISEDLHLELGKELADIIHYAVAIAAVNQIDLNKIMLEKDKKASEKYHHDVNLEMFIQNHQ